jgi:hypothetical protein
VKGDEVMSANLEDLQGDMHVYGSDGERIGRVGGVFVEIETGRRFLNVTRFGEDLWVPESAVEPVRLGHDVRLKIRKDEAIRSFSVKPDVV